MCLFFRGSIWPLYVVFQPVIESICLCISTSLSASFCTAQGLLFIQHIQGKLLQESVSEQLDEPDPDPVVMSSAFNPWLEINLPRLQGRPSP